MVGINLDRRKEQARAASQLGPYGSRHCHEPPKIAVKGVSLACIGTAVALFLGLWLIVKGFKPSPITMGVAEPKVAR